ncbi:MAG: hypothetical protein ABI947_28130 [Chloroflexota bacterium]
MNINDVKAKLDQLDQQVSAQNWEVELALQTLAENPDDNAAHQRWQRATARLAALPKAREHLEQALNSLEAAQYQLAREHLVQAIAQADKASAKAARDEHKARENFVTAATARLQAEEAQRDAEEALYSYDIPAIRAAGEQPVRPTADWTRLKFDQALIALLSAWNMAAAAKSISVRVPAHLGRRVIQNLHDSIEASADSTPNLVWYTKEVRPTNTTWSDKGDSFEYVGVAPTYVDPEPQSLLQALADAMLLEALAQPVFGAFSQSLGQLKQAVIQVGAVQFTPQPTNRATGLIRQLNAIACPPEVIEAVQELVKGALK